VDGTAEPLADNVVIPPGRGALVRSVAANGTTVGLYLITDLGVAYPISPGSSSSVLTDLGLGSATISDLPESMVRLIPVGPLLDDTVAMAEQPANPPSAVGTAPASAEPGTSP
jgi:hypothetical protein